MMVQGKQVHTTACARCECPSVVHLVELPPCLETRRIFNATATLTAEGAVKGTRMRRETHFFSSHLCHFFSSLSAFFPLFYYTSSAYLTQFFSFVLALLVAVFSVYQPPSPFDFTRFHPLSYLFLHRYT